MAASTKPLRARGEPGVIASLPRRKLLPVSLETAAPSQMRLQSYQYSRTKALARLFTWFGLLFQVSLATVLDHWRGKDSRARRAWRLRQAFERRGGSFAKLGIHLSMRADLVPWVYSVELSRMYDHQEPFPVETAIQIIEAATGRPLPTIFSRFDPRPIDSNSLACIYRAVFHNGEGAIVKVRRPGVTEQFMADLKAFDWLLILAEALTIFRPGFTQGIRTEFRTYLLEELDFVSAARRQDSFRRAAAASRKDFFSAPRVYLGLTSEEVVVEEFVVGPWLWELLAAVDQGNEAVLARARQMNIVPAAVARRLLWVNNWSREENLFFHADPHPHNIILGQDSRLYYINFSVTASLSRSQRQAMQQNMEYLRQRDPLNMARSCLNLLEPLPLVDVMQLIQELESYNWQLVYALEAAPASESWPERTSAVQWIGMIRLARKYRIALDDRVLRAIRATLLVESTAVRLQHDIDFEQEYRKFHRYRTQQARRRVTDSVQSQLDGQLDDKLIIRIDRIGQVLRGLFFRTRRFLALPSVNFNDLMGKWSFAIYILMRWVVQATAVTVAAGLLVAGGSLLGRGLAPPSPANILGTLTSSPIYWSVLVVLTVVHARTILFRLDDVDS